MKIENKIMFNIEKNKIKKFKIIIVEGNYYRIEKLKETLNSQFLSEYFKEHFNYIIDSHNIEVVFIGYYENISKNQFRENTNNFELILNEIKKEIHHSEMYNYYTSFLVNLFFSKKDLICGILEPSNKDEFSKYFKNENIVIKIIKKYEEKYNFCLLLTCDIYSKIWNLIFDDEKWKDNYVVPFYLVNKDEFMLNEMFKLLII